MGRGQGKRGWEAGERIEDCGKNKLDNVKVKLLNHLIITEICLLLFFYCEIGSDTIFDVHFHCLAIFLSLRVFVSLSVSQYDVLFFIYLNVCHKRLMSWSYETHGWFRTRRTNEAKHWKSVRNQPPVRCCGEIHMDGL